MPKISAGKLDQEIAQNTIAPVYLLTGEDVYRKNRVIASLRVAIHPDDFNIYKSDADKADLGEALSLANTAPVFSEKRLVILTGVEKLRKDPKEALLAYMDNPLPTTVLILTHNDSKKLKTEKGLVEVAADTGRVCNYDELSQGELALWAKEQLKARGLTADFDAVEVLCDAVGAELSALENEVEKLSLYVYGRTNPTIKKEDVLACIGFAKEENPFELSNAITACQKDRAIRLVDRLIDDGEDAVGILSKMSYPILKMARIKRLSNAGIAPSEILRTAGLMFWESKLVNMARSFPSEEAFFKTLNRLIEADMAFKSSTNTDPKTTLKGILLTLFSK